MLVFSDSISEFLQEIGSSHSGEPMIFIDSSQKIVHSILQDQSRGTKTMRTPVLRGRLGPETVICGKVDAVRFGRIVLRLGKTHFFAANDGSPIQTVTLAGEYDPCSGFLVRTGEDRGFFRY